MNLVYFGITLILLLVTTFLVTVIAFDLINLIKGHAPNLSSNKKALESLQEIYNFTKGQNVADFGAGYGSVLWKLKDLRIKLTGYEINPLLYIYLKLKFSNYKNVKIIKENFLKTDLNEQDVIIIYGVEKVMEKLEQKVIREKPTDLTIISNRFKLPKMKHAKNLGSLYLYEL